MVAKCPVIIARVIAAMVSYDKALQFIALVCSHVSSWYNLPFHFVMEYTKCVTDLIEISNNTDLCLNV